MKSTNRLKVEGTLKGAATTAAGVGIATVATKTASVGLEKHSSSDYRETKHIKTYYELAKF